MWKMILLFSIITNALIYSQTDKQRSPWGLSKIGDGTTSNFRIDKIFVNPNSNPTQVFTNFNLPDSLETSILITNNKLDTIFIKKKIELGPGEYQFFLNYTTYSDMTQGVYTIHFEFKRGRELIYYSSIRAIFL